MVALKVFAAQFIYILLLGLQQLNVVHHNYPGAFVVSLALGIFGFYLTAVVAEVRRDGIFTKVWWSFIFAGPLGIVTAIYWHPHLEAAYKAWIA